MAGSESSEPTDARLLDLAADHIRQHGLARTTVVAIAREAQMSHGNVYRYFPSKEALVDAVSTQWLKVIEAGARDICDAPDPVFDKLERILAGVHSAYRNKLESDPKIFDLFVEASREGRGVARRHRLKLQAEVTRVVEEAGFSPADQRRALALIFDMCHRFLNPGSVRADADVTRAQIEARFERVVRALIRTLSASQF
jgi:AcrR family transcriptional regulator